MAEVKLYLLGSPRLERGGKPVDMDTRKALALLAFLAVTGQPHQREELAALLYPDYDPASGRAAFRRTLSTLNTALGEGILNIRRDAVGMLESKPIWVDVVHFKHLVASCAAHGHSPSDVCRDCLPTLKEAAALHHGDFMAGFSLRDSLDYDDWQFEQAEDHRRELSRVLEKLAAGLAAVGEFEQAIDAARQWSNLDPLLEESHRMLMRLYAWTGQRSAALRQYRDCVRILEQELHVSPLEETTRIYQAVAENQDIPRSVLPRIASQPAAKVEAQPGLLASSPLHFHLVGRSKELAVITRSYQESRKTGCFFVLEGEPGVGKTRLAEDFITQAQLNSAPVLSACCYDGEANLAYAPLVQLLRSTLSALTEPARLRAIPDDWLLEASRLVPELSGQQPHPAVLPPLEGPGAQTHFYEGIFQTLLGLLDGNPPGILFIDDLHWVDAATLEFLAYLVRRLPTHSLFVLAAWRNDAALVEPNLRRLVSETRRSGIAKVLTLSRLSPSEVSELIQSVEPIQAGFNASLVKRLYHEAEGLPFFVVEYLASLMNKESQPSEQDWEMPRSVRELLQSRLASVSETGAQVLGAAAVIGRSFDFDTLREVCGRSETETVNALDSLLALNLVHEHASGPGGGLLYDFNHEKLRELVYTELSMARRRLLHRRAAETLISQARGRRETGVFTSQIARHAELGGQEALASEYYRLAGEQARQLYANTEAIAHFQAAIALNHPQSADLYQVVGDLQTLNGDYAEAIHSYQISLSLCQPDCAAQVEQKLAAVHHRRREWDLADACFQRADEILSDQGDPGDLARLYADWSRTAHHSGRAERAMNLARRALELAEQAGDLRALAQAHNILGILHRGLGDPALAIQSLQRSLEITQGSNDPGTQAAALNNLALVYVDRDDWSQAIPLFQTALELCSRQGDRHREAALHNNLADLYHTAGDEEKSLEHLRQAVVIFAEIGADSAGMHPETWMLTEW